MRRHPRVALATLWMRWPYPGWSEWRKRDLRNAVNRILDDGVYPALADPPANKRNYNDGDTVEQMVLAKNRAWNLYLAYVAHAIALEIRRELPWSLNDLSSADLRQLLASHTFFEYRFGRRGYAIEVAPHGRALPAPPDVIFGFLRDAGLLRGNRRETIAAVLEWCRDHLVHFTGHPTAANLEEHWQYRGMPPVSRIIAGTNHPSGFGHYTAGCWGTVGFLRAVLRTAGIPVMLEPVGGHALASFPTESRYLSHGDDPYNRLFKTMLDLLSGADLFVTRTRWNRWYRLNFSESAKARNVGRQVAELARNHLSWRLLHVHCQDLADGKSHADSQVYHEIFKDYFTLRQLEDGGLWEKMDTKLAEIGGCAVVPDV